jgi:hypothetical protein
MKKEIDVYEEILKSNQRLIEINNHLIEVNEGWQDLATRMLKLCVSALEKAGDKHEADLQ